MMEDGPRVRLREGDCPLPVFFGGLAARFLGPTDGKERVTNKVNSSTFGDAFGPHSGPYARMRNELDMGIS